MDEILLHTGVGRYVLGLRRVRHGWLLRDADELDPNRARWLTRVLLVNVGPMRVRRLRVLPAFRHLDDEQLLEAIVREVSTLGGALVLARLRPAAYTIGSTVALDEPLASECNDASSVAKTINCELRGLALTCKHADTRGFELALPDPDRPSVLAVVGAARGEGDPIEVRASFGKSGCAEHGGHHLSVRSPTGELMAFDTTASFDAWFGDANIGPSDLWPWAREPVRWEVTPHACKVSNGLVATVEVYPDIQPNVDFKLNLGEPGHLAKYAADTANRWHDRGAVDRRGRPRHHEWSIEASFAIAYGSRTWDFSAKITDKLKSKGGLNLAVKRFINRVNAWVYKKLGVSVYPVLPSLALSYSGKFGEIKGSSEVGTEWTMSFAAKPLIGLTVRFDVLHAILRLARLVPYTAPVAIVLEKAIAWGKDNGQVVALYIEIEGTVEGDIGGRKPLSRPRDSTKVEFTGKVGGKFVFSFKGTASFSGKFIVTWEVGAEIGGDSGLSAELEAASDDRGVYLTGDAKILEGAIKMAYWASGSFEWQGSGEAKSSKKYVIWNETNIWDPVPIRLLG